MNMIIDSRHLLPVYFKMLLLLASSGSPHWCLMEGNFSGVYSTRVYLHKFGSITFVFIETFVESA